MPFERIPSIGEREKRNIETLERLHQLEAAEDRMNLILTYLGEKPVSLVAMGYPLKENPEETIRRAILEKEEVEETLSRVGLKFKSEEVEFEHEGVRWKAFRFEVARDQKILEQLEEAISRKDCITQGRLFGYPETAIKAFAKGGELGKLGEYSIIDEKKWWFSLTEEERENLLREGVLNFLVFRLSQENWREELETVRRWQGIIREKAPTLYEEIMKKDPWGNRVKKWEEGRE